MSDLSTMIERVREVQELDAMRREIKKLKTEVEELKKQNVYPKQLNAQWQNALSEQLGLQGVFFKDWSSYNY